MKLDTSEFIVKWLTGLEDATFEEIANRICDKGNKWIKQISEACPPRPRHTFILAGFSGDRPKLAVISNFENCFGRNDSAQASLLTVSQIQFIRKTQIVVTGMKSAVNRLERRRLKRSLSNKSGDPARIRRDLSKINHKAATSLSSKGLISAECSVVSIRTDSQGVYDINGAVEFHMLSFGEPILPHIQNLCKKIGWNNTRMHAIAFASSRSRKPFKNCEPKIVTPVDASNYTVHEMSHEAFDSYRAIDVNDYGVMVGDCNRSDKPGINLMWTSQGNGELLPTELIALPGGINNKGEIAVQVKMSDNTSHAVRLMQQGIIDLGSHAGQESGGNAINSNGVVAGYVRINSDNRSQINFRPAAWSSDHG